MSNEKEKRNELEKMLKNAWEHGSASAHDTKTSAQYTLECECYLDDIEEDIDEIVSQLKEEREKVKKLEEKDISFISEILDTLKKGEVDPTQREYAYQMLNDWKDELQALKQ